MNEYKYPPLININHKDDPSREVVERFMVMLIRFDLGHPIPEVLNQSVKSFYTKDIKAFAKKWGEHKRMIITYHPTRGV